MSHELFLEKQHLPKIVILLESLLVKLSENITGLVYQNELEELESVLFDSALQELPEKYEDLRVKNVVLASLKPLQKGSLSPGDIECDKK